MLELKCGSNTAIVVLHEIYGINPHIRRVCHEYHAMERDVYCLNLIGRDEPFSYAQQNEAYRYFIENVGFDTSYIVTLLQTLRPQYDNLILVGFSVGATLAWLAARSGLCARVVCHYGSRIREHSDIAPPCPVLVILARHEASFDTTILQSELKKYPNVDSRIFSSHHGFCDGDNANFDAENADLATRLVHQFIG